MIDAECAMSEWSNWGSCSHSCGPGQKHRQRHYLYKNHDKKNCHHVRLTDKKSCMISRCRQVLVNHSHFYIFSHLTIVVNKVSTIYKPFLFLKD